MSGASIQGQLSLCDSIPSIFTLALHTGEIIFLQAASLGPVGCSSWMFSSDQAKDGSSNLVTRRPALRITYL